MGSRLRTLFKLLCPRCGCDALFRRTSSSSAADRAMDNGSQKDFGPHPIVAVFRQALTTFNPRTMRSQAELDAGLEKLRTLMDGIRAADVGLDDALVRPGTWDAPNKAPCTYVELFENEHINMSMFILRPGFKMPLHDHPQMHGLLKVVSGAVNLRSFTKTNLMYEESVAEPSSSLFSKKTNSKRTLFAEVITDTVLKDDSITCVLTPYEAILHEIEALEWPAAFVDILAPPYDTVMENNGPRRCNYYRVINEISTNVVQLEEIRPPSWFYCDQAPYLGPLLV